MSHETIEATHALPPPPGSIKDKDGLVTWPHEPWLHGYLAKDLANWSQATDPYAKYLRSRVPLAQRIPVFSATQANPRLTYGPQVSELSRDYVLNMTCRGLRYQDDATLRTSRFWQYVDMFGAWHGVITAGASPPDCSVYGVVNLPNPAWTDAAHRNGVKSLGCWYWPRTDDFAQLVAKKADGSFPVADRLLAMAAYFGFDGYFINQEAQLTPEDKREALAKALMEMFAYMRAKAPASFHLQWYDAMLPNGDLGYQNEFNAANSPWIRNGGTRVCDSISSTTGGTRRNARRRVLARKLSAWLPMRSSPSARTSATTASSSPTTTPASTSPRAAPRSTAGACSTRPSSSARRPARTCTTRPSRRSATRWSATSGPAPRATRRGPDASARRAAAPATPTATTRSGTASRTTSPSAR